MVILWPMYGEAVMADSITVIESCGYFITRIRRRPLDSYERIEVTRKKFGRVKSLPDFCEVLQVA